MLSQQEKTLNRKRSEYLTLKSMCLSNTEFRSESDIKLYKQIIVDVPRTMPEYKFFQQPVIMEMLINILYIWNLRHPASGYVQGINDICTPFIIVFLSEYIPNIFPSIECTDTDLKTITKEIFNKIEADVYNCLCSIIDRLQSIYIANQPGAQKMMEKMQIILKRVNPELENHLNSQGVLFVQFAFRWINCLLMREFTLPTVIRMWDTYFSEEDSTEVFHVYVCVALIVHFKKEILSRDFQSIILFMQDLPTKSWNIDDMRTLMSEAYLLKKLFENAQNHLKNQG